MFQNRNIKVQLGMKQICKKKTICFDESKKDAANKSNFTLYTMYSGQ